MPTLWGSLARKGKREKGVDWYESAAPTILTSGSHAGVPCTCPAKSKAAIAHGALKLGILKTKNIVAFGWLHGSWRPDI